MNENGYPPRPEGCAGVALAALIIWFVIILTIVLLWPWGVLPWTALLPSK